MSEANTQNQTTNSPTPHVTISVVPGVSSSNAMVPAAPTNAMSKTLADAGVSIQLSTEDVLAIRLAEEEKNLHALISKAQERLKTTQRSIATTDASLATLVTSYVPSWGTVDKGKTLMGALSLFYGCEFVDSYTREMREDKNSGLVYARTTMAIRAKIENNSIPDHFANENIPATPDHLNLLHERVNLLGVVADIENEIQGYRRKLANLPALARQARASLVSAVIGDNAEGKRLLDAIRGTASIEST